MAEHPRLVEEGLGEQLREVVEARRRLVVEDKEVQERLRTLQEGLLKALMVPHLFHSEILSP